MYVHECLVLEDCKLTQEMKISAVIHAFNEEESIAEVVKRSFSHVRAARNGQEIECAHVMVPFTR